MNVFFKESPYIRMTYKSNHGETLFGHLVSDGSLEALGYLYETPEGKWLAHFHNPEFEREFNTRDEAANILVILSTQRSNDLLFLPNHN